MLDINFNQIIEMIEKRKNNAYRKVKMKDGKIFILKQLSNQASLKDKILIYILKDYTYRIYTKGAKKELTGIYSYWQTIINTLKV